MTHLQTASPAPSPSFTDKRRYFDPVLGSHATKVLPGECAVADDNNYLVATVGTAAVLVLWDAANLRAGMAHVMVSAQETAHWTETSVPSPTAENVVATMQRGLNAMEGVSPQWQGFVVGGGMIKLFDKLTAGNENVMWAVDWLHRNRIPMAYYETGQTLIRKLYMNPASGEMTIKRIGYTRNETVNQREEHYVRFINGEPENGRLFYPPELVEKKS